jgi:hypothetical protein
VKHASEIEQEHLDDLKSAVSDNVIAGGFSVSKVIETIVKQENKPSSDDVTAVHLKENNMQVPSEKPEAKVEVKVSVSKPEPVKEAPKEAPKESPKEPKPAA